MFNTIEELVTMTIVKRSYTTGGNDWYKKQQRYTFLTIKQTDFGINGVHDMQNGSYEKEWEQKSKESSAG